MKSALANADFQFNFLALGSQIVCLKSPFGGFRRLLKNKTADNHRQATDHNPLTADYCPQTLTKNKRYYF